jgi:hypothetical protein
MADKLLPTLVSQLDAAERASCEIALIQFVLTNSTPALRMPDASFRTNRLKSPSGRSNTHRSKSGCLSGSQLGKMTHKGPGQFREVGVTHADAVFVRSRTENYLLRARYRSIHPNVNPVQIAEGRYRAKVAVWK